MLISIYCATQEIVVHEIILQFYNGNEIKFKINLKNCKTQVTNVSGGVKLKSLSTK